MQAGCSLARVSCLLLWVAMLSGCAGTNELGTGRSYPEKGVGYVVGSLSFNQVALKGKPYLFDVPEIDVSFSSENYGDSSEFKLHTRTRGSNVGIWYNPELSVSEEGGKRGFVLVSVPPGRYLLRTYRARFTSPTKELLVGERSAKAVVVREGEVTYVGNIQMSFTVGETIFGVASPDRARFSFRNDVAADTKAIFKLKPQLQSLPLTNALRDWE